MRPQQSVARYAAWSAAILTTVAVAILIIIGIIAGVKAFGRSQARADANNAVSITHIKIRQQQQYARVVAAQDGIVQAKAEQRYLASVGIRRAQDEIAKTLTPLYVQHEAIEAQQAVATSGSNDTVVYVPSGQNGVPIVTASAGTGK